MIHIALGILFTLGVQKCILLWSPWWPIIKREVDKYLEERLTCLKVKSSHQKPYGEVQSLPILRSKWDNITMYFVKKLPRTSNGFNSILVIVDWRTKWTHFLLIRESYTTGRLAKKYIDELVRRHGITTSIVSDRDSRFTSTFWQCFQEQMGSKVIMSID